MIDSQSDFVSIIMPTYNCQNFVGDAIQSVIDQTYKNWELIIVDDYSTDETPLELDRFRLKDSRIRVFRLPENSGSPAAPRNKGIEEAHGRFIAFIDSDDCWLPEKLNVQVAAMLKDGYLLSCTSYSVIDEVGVAVGSFKVPAQATFSDILRHNTLGCLTVMYDSSKLGKLYFPRCGHEDYALWLDITRRGVKVLGINEKLAVYRLRHGSVSSNKLKVLTFFWHIYRRRMNFNPFYSLLLCANYAFHARNKYRE